MKKMISAVVAALALTGVVFGAGADVVPKYSGPSGSGEVIWWAPSTGTTNLVMTTNGITVLTDAGSAVTISSLASNKVFIGNASGVPVAQSISGDVTITTNGAVTIGAGAVTAAKTSVASNKVFIGNASGIAAAYTLTGDVTLNTTGAVTVTRGTAFTNTFVTSIAGLTATSINVISRSVAYDGLYVTLGAITTNAVNTDVP